MKMVSTAVVHETILDVRYSLDLSRLACTAGLKSIEGERRSSLTRFAQSAISRLKSVTRSERLKDWALVGEKVLREESALVAS